MTPADSHIHNAQAYARQLDYERTILRERVDPQLPLLPRELAAAQGEALRLTIVECARAIVAAIRETGDLHAREVAAVRASLVLADTPEDRHGTYPKRTIAERRRAWLHEHVGEPLPAELRPDAATQPWNQMYVNRRTGERKAWAEVCWEDPSDWEPLPAAELREEAPDAGAS